MIGKHFTEEFDLQIYEEASSDWSDGEGHWNTVAYPIGYMRTLGANERSETTELITTHRLYTSDDSISFGDRLVKDNLVYDVKLVDHKKFPRSTLNFFQVDCELIR